MKVINAHHVQDGLYKGLLALCELGEKEQSRNGPVIVYPSPVTTVFHNPTWRVMQDPVRDANPFFHVMETIWMLAGRNDARYVSQFVKRMNEFSDDGETLNGAYGYRWRHWFGRDQIIDAYEELQRDPQSRRCVIAMWDPKSDDVGGKDVPCNTHIYFRIRRRWLDMTVCNRSNDIYWGLFGANAVHLSFLHELLARGLGVQVGLWRQISNNFHVYPENLPQPLQELTEGLAQRMDTCWYSMPTFDPMFSTMPVIPRFQHPRHFITACEIFCERPQPDTGVEFLDHVAFPMLRYWETRDDFWAPLIRDDVWRKACEEWVARRAAK